MLCPQCRRQVGKDGYCASGHLAAPERAEPPEPVRRVPGVPAPSAEDAPPAPGAPPSIPTPVARASAAKPIRRPLTMALVFVLLSAGVLGYLAFGPSASAANLKYVFENGERHRYNLSMTFDISAGNLAFGGAAFKGSLEMVLTQKTTAVAKDGIATIQYGVEKARVIADGRAVDIPVPATALTVRMTPDGRILSAQGAGLLEIGGDDPVSDFSGLFGPEAFGPILPDRNVDPGESWKIDQDMANPFGETIRYRGTATLLSRSQTKGQEAAVIRTQTNTPLNVRITLADLAKLAKEALPNELKDAAMAFNGYFTTNFTQSLATESGFLLSAIGDLKMTGTIAFDNFPEVGDLSAVFNMTFQVTMTSIS